MSNVAGDTHEMAASFEKTWLHRAAGHVASSPEAHIAEMIRIALKSGVLNPIGDHTSDGYHTFAELYWHRALLTAALFHAWCWTPTPPAACYRTRLHHPDDEEPMFAGMFKVGAELPSGEITYHYPNCYWDLFASVDEIPHSPKYDGHTSNDVAERLDNYLRGKW